MIVAVRHNESVASIALRCIQNLLGNFKRRKKTHPINQNALSLCILSTVLRTFLKQSHFCGEWQCFSEDMILKALYSLQFHQLKTLCRNIMEHVKTLYSWAYAFFPRVMDSVRHPNVMLFAWLVILVWGLLDVLVHQAT